SGAGASFEEALKRVDASLEQLVEAPRPSHAEPPVEAQVEGVVEAVVEQSPSGESEAELGDPNDPNDAAKARRQRLLRRAMENLGAIPNPRATSTSQTEPSLPQVSVVEPEAPKAASNAPK